jgi:hypothetical protein
MAEKVKYLDQTRYPKVVTEGYEKQFQENYHKQVLEMGKQLINKMLKLVKK